MSEPAAWYRWDGPDLVLQLLIQPRSSRNALGEIHDNRLKIMLTSPPVDGKANKALVEMLAGLFAIPRSRVCIVRGDSGRRKTIILSRPAHIPESLDIKKP